MRQSLPIRCALDLLAPVSIYTCNVHSFGGEVLYVLRPAEIGLYTVVGDCYIDTIMHGESLSHDTIPGDFRLR
jgi:hypothetical protein